MSVDPLTDENGRLAALRRYQRTEAGAPDAFSGITTLVQQTLEVPIAALSFIERDSQIFRSVRGMPDAPIPRKASICAHTIATPRPFVVPDTHEDARFAGNPLVAGPTGVRAYLGAPLLTPQGYAVGTLAAMDTRPRDFNAHHGAILSGLAAQVVEQMELRQIGEFDQTTNALTRRAFQAEVERDFLRSSRYERPSALVFLDIDHFAKINEAFGHMAGDDALRAVAQRCQQVLRQTDTFGRVGSEEFAFLLPETSAYEATQCAERVREIVEKLRFKTEAGVLSVTASFGVSALHPGIKSAAQWFAEADVALYAARTSGRNCVMLSTPDRTPVLPPYDDPSKPNQPLNLH